MTSTNNQIFKGRIKTPLGDMVVCSTAKGICLLEFADNPRLEPELAELESKLKSEIVESKNQHIDLCEIELTQYFSGERTDFSVPLDLVGTDFQKRVWSQLLEVPHGETWTYQSQANKYGNLKAIRAIASANGKNKVSILVPCHRVVGSSGSLTGYSGGIERKRKLLQHEGLNV